MVAFMWVIDSYTDMHRDMHSQTYTHTYLITKNVNLENCMYVILTTSSHFNLI